MAERMKIIAEDAKTITMLDYFQGHPMHFYMDKATREIHVSAQDMAKALGYKDQEALLGSDAALDALLEYRKKNPDKPFLKTRDDL